MIQPVSGFYKKSKEEKIKWLQENYLTHFPEASVILKQYWNDDASLQQLHDDFIENTVSNYYLPLGIATNFLINNSLYAIPMVIEESSVVAAASNAAKFWLDKGGFKAEVISTQKNGQVHLNYEGTPQMLEQFFIAIKNDLLESIEAIEKNMKMRGGGLVTLELKDSTHSLKGYYQLHATFETLDAMGANFINTCLETFAKIVREKAVLHVPFKETNVYPEVVMSILSNYVPECLVKASVSCPVKDLAQEEMTGMEFATKFTRAIAIAKAEPRRAVTHNKGIMNGIDAVVLATGNDFRAVEAGIHAYASKDGKYTSLTHASIEDGIFHFWIEIPIAIGTVGGLTSLHPLVKVGLELLQKPSAPQLMQLIAVAGLAQNFAALRSLTTVGIQKGHMKMHLMNMLNQVKATISEKEQSITHFKENAVSHNAVLEYIESLRK